MKAAILGGQAEELARKVKNVARAVSAGELSGTAWDVLALTAGGVATLRDGAGGVFCHTLLLPGDGEIPAGITALQVIGYGLSPRDTLTLSGVGTMACLQREVKRIDGETVEPQEIPIAEDLRELPSEQALLLTGLRLLMPRC